MEFHTAFSTSPYTLKTATKSQESFLLQRPLLNQNCKNQTHTALFGCASSVLWAPWSFHLVGFFGWQWELRPAIWSWLHSPHSPFRVHYPGRASHSARLGERSSLGNSSWKLPCSMQMAKIAWQMKELPNGPRETDTCWGFRKPWKNMILHRKEKKTIPI